MILFNRQDQIDAQDLNIPHWDDNPQIPLVIPISPSPQFL